MSNPTIAQALAFIDAITKSAGGTHFDAVLGKGATISSKDIESADPDTLDRVDVFLEHIEDCSRTIRQYVKGRPRQTKLTVTEGEDGVSLEVTGGGSAPATTKSIQEMQAESKKRLQAEAKKKSAKKKSAKKKS